MLRGDGREMYGLRSRSQVCAAGWVAHASYIFLQCLLSCSVAEIWEREWSTYFLATKPLSSSAAHFLDVRIFWRTQQQSSTIDQASPSQVLEPRARIHQERAMTTVYIPELPPLASIAHFSRSGIKRERLLSSMQRHEGWRWLHQALNCGPYSPGAIGTGCFFCAFWRFIHCATWEGRAVIDKFYKINVIDEISKLRRNLHHSRGFGFWTTKAWKRGSAKLGPSKSAVSNQASTKVGRSHQRSGRFSRMHLFLR